MIIRKLDIPKTIYVDLDNTLNYYGIHLVRAVRNFPNLQYPQSMSGFYRNIEPIPEGLEVMRLLKDANFHVCIATRPSYPNLHCYTEKAEWVKKYLGEEWLPDLYLVPNKAKLIGDILVDDNACPEFTGHMLVFDGDWWSVLKQIKQLSGI